MSQTRPPSAELPDDPGPPLRGTDSLVSYFAAAGKTRDRFRIGTEHEKFGILRLSRAPLPFEGPNGIEAIFRDIAANPGPGEMAWIPVTDGGRTVALYCEDGCAITLEPGGQIELSGIPLRTVHETSMEIEHHLELLRRHCLSRGIAFIGIGFHPVARWVDMPTVPKDRYRVLEPYLRKTGGRGLDMMKLTSTVQANLDYADEADMVASFQTALTVSPVVAALFANGPFREGRPGGVVSERLLIWEDTDPARCGYPQAVLERDFGFERWIDFVLDVPMLFVRRDGRHRPVAGLTFRQFLRDGMGGVRATLRDFEDHLTTIFTEVRLKRYLEMRSADCGPWSRICALPALWKGLLYDPIAREAARALMNEPAAAELSMLQQDVARHGFQARYRGQPILKIAAQLVDIASDGLLRLDCRNFSGDDERIYLQPLRALIDDGRTFGERLLHLYRTEWNGSLEPMWDDIEFLPQVLPAVAAGQ